MYVWRRKVIDLRDRLAFQDLLWGPRCPDRVIEKDEGLCVPGHILHIMGRAEDSETLCPLEIADLIVEAGSGRRIQPRSRLVQDQQTGVRYQGSGDESSLLLAS